MNGLLLFVYGTLRAGAPHPMARWLGRRADLRGKALFQGRLYALGAYPGAIGSTRAGERVVGDLYRLRRERDLKSLDRYEGGMRCRATPEYRRQRVVVTLGGEPFECWIYLYDRSVRFKRPIRSGDWLRGGIGGRQG